MKQHTRRLTLLSLVLALAAGTALPASAFSLFRANQAPAVAAFSKNGPMNQTISFQAEDFRVEGKESLDSILLTALPDLDSGVLTLGDTELTLGSAVGSTALDGLRFRPLSHPARTRTSFSFTPYFSDGSAGAEVTVDLHLLAAENAAPIAENLTLQTYKNIPLTARFSATDPEGDLLTFRLVEKPARGSVTMVNEMGGAEFVYTPYENKTGKDTFTYVATDAVGNTSQPATVTLRIEKSRTQVTYADMTEHAAYYDAVRLAEEDIFVGECLNGEHFFRPDETVSRNEFVAMAMRLSGQDALRAIARTGFADDENIPAWAKGYVASGLKAGVLKGTLSPEGQIVFQGSDPVTRAEASVLLDRMLRVTDVPAQVACADWDSTPAWAAQSAANLESVGVLQADETGALSLSSPLTRSDAAALLTGALGVLEARESNLFR